MKKNVLQRLTIPTMKTYSWDGKFSHFNSSVVSILFKGTVQLKAFTLVKVLPNVFQREAGFYNVLKLGMPALTCTCTPPCDFFPQLLLFSSLHNPSWNSTRLTNTWNLTTSLRKKTNMLQKCSFNNQPTKSLRGKKLLKKSLTLRKVSGHILLAKLVNQQNSFNKTCNSISHCGSY